MLVYTGERNTSEMSTRKLLYTRTSKHKWTLEYFSTSQQSVQTLSSSIFIFIIRNIILLHKPFTREKLCNRFQFIRKNEGTDATTTINKSSEQVVELFNNCTDSSGLRKNQNYKKMCFFFSLLLFLCFDFLQDNVLSPVIFALSDSDFFL